MKLTYTPAICHDGQYEGTITLQMLTYDERNDFQDRIDISPEEIKKETSEKQKEKQGRKIIRLAAKLLPSKLLESNLKRVSDGFVFDTWDKIQYDSELAAVVTEAALKLVGKFRVGDPS